ncbi:4'-phosphopantetheinyl transferase superfamily protein [Streptomyces sp. NPDC086554]|uniref:holo-ACP synthase n=1 Tax=Streptomyces sp. NPDC086554 TaxID=3154864 RepID=UPI00342566C2
MILWPGPTASDCRAAVSASPHRCSTWDESALCGSRSGRCGGDAAGPRPPAAFRGPGLHPRRARILRHPQDSAERYAVRFAAKEAVLKALGVGLSGAALTKIEVVRAPSGSPALRLTGRAAPST